MRRRAVLAGIGSASAFGTAGCLGAVEELANRPADSTPGEEPVSGDRCRKYQYQADGSNEDAQWPWDLTIRQISLETYPVSIAITGLSGNSGELIVSCTATSDDHTEFEFDLPPASEYRVSATLHRPDEPEEASITVDGDRLGSDGYLRVAVEGGEFGIEHWYTDYLVTDSR